MGMDVFGRNPKNSDGEYFRANVWSWRPIHSLICHIAKDLFDEETLESMAFNDGAGLETQEECDLLADRFNMWLENNVDGVVIEQSAVRVDDCGRFLGRDSSDPGRSPYQTSDDHIKSFVAFLRGCGGFRVC